MAKACLIKKIFRYFERSRSTDNSLRDISTQTIWHCYVSTVTGTGKDTESGQVDTAGVHPQLVSRTQREKDGVDNLPSPQYRRETFTSDLSNRIRLGVLYRASIRCSNPKSGLQLRSACLVTAQETY